MNLKYRDFIDRLSKLNDEEKEILANNIVKEVERIHMIKYDDINWTDTYQINVNMSLYEHGLIRNPGLNDYILADFIKDNIYYIKDRRVSKSIRNNSIFDIDIEDINNVKVEYNQNYYDKIMDFVELNVISYFDNKFANRIVSKIIKNEIENKFFRIFSIYTAHYCLDMLVYLSKSKNTVNAQQLEELQQISNYIFQTFEDFTIFKPNWISKF